jgi:adenylate cyclase
VLHEMAATGGTDYFALPLEYGDGSVQGLSLVSDGPDGFAAHGAGGLRQHR